MLRQLNPHRYLHCAMTQAQRRFSSNNNNNNNNNNKCDFVHLHNDPSTYFLHGQDSRELSASQMKDMADFVSTDPLGESFMVYNSHEAIRKVTNWKKIVPWIEPHYALKSNPTNAIVRDLTQNGAGLDVASRREITQGLELGVHASKMIYSNPVKEENDIRYAAENGILCTTADTVEELLKIREIAPNMKVLWRISIPEDTSANNGTELATGFSNKFGDDITSIEEAHAKFKYLAKEIGVKLHGIHFHCGSGRNGSPLFRKAISVARKCLEIGRIYGHPMELLDIGGGFPAGELNEGIFSAIQDTYNDPLGYRVIAEPGRHFSSHACYIFTRVLARRYKSGRPCFHVNDSVYHAFTCVSMNEVSFENDFDQVYGEIKNRTKSIVLKQPRIVPASLFGMTCDGMDVISKNVGLPENLQMGDWMCFSGMGSYTFQPKSEFNGMISMERVFEWNSPIAVHSHQKHFDFGSSPLSKQHKSSPILESAFSSSNK